MNSPIEKLNSFFSNRLFWWNYHPRPVKSNSSIKLGWCSVFPPVENGVADITYKTINKLLQRKDIEVYAIPFKGIIDKRLFPNLKFAKLNDKFLDAVMFCCLGTDYESIAKSAKAKRIVWQTVHYSPTDAATPRPGTYLLNGDKVVFDQIKNSDLCITVSRWAADEYRKLGLGNVEYLPFGTELKEINVQKRSSYNPFRVLFVSRLQYYKGIVPFLETMDYVLKVHPDVEFYMHAPLDVNSEHKEEMLRCIEKYRKKYPTNFKHQSKWISFEEINKVYETSDVLVFPSSNEGFGIPIIEAMSYGIPCLVTDRPPMNEMVDEDINGFCIPIDKNNSKKYHNLEFPSPVDMAKMITWLIEHPEQMKQMGQKAKEKVKEEYHMTRVIDALIEQVKKLVQK